MRFQGHDGEGSREKFWEAKSKGGSGIMGLVFLGILETEGGLAWRASTSVEGRRG